MTPAEWWYANFHERRGSAWKSKLDILDVIEEIQCEVLDDAADVVEQRASHSTSEEVRAALFELAEELRMGKP